MLDQILKSISIPGDEQKFNILMDDSFEECSCTNTATLREHSKVTESILSIYSSDKSLEWRVEIPLHVKYLRKCLLSPLPEPYICLDASQPWLCYWAIHSLELLDPASLVDEMIVERVKSILEGCKKHGPFGGSPHQIPHLAPTYAAVMALCVMEDYTLLDTGAMKEYLISMKNSDGSFRMHDRGETDIRATYCAVAVAYLTNTLDDDMVRGIAEHIGRCQSKYEGGIGACPGAEAHGGYTYCATATLCILKDSDYDISGHVDLDRLGEFVGRLQCKETGAFRGRTGKLVDACYSFWVGATVPLLRQLGVNVPYDCQGLQRYLLMASKESAGFRDKPGKPADYYHTCYALSGLAVSQAEHPGAASLGDVLLPPVDARFNACPGKVHKMRQHFAK